MVKPEYVNLKLKIKKIIFCLLLGNTVSFKALVLINKKALRFFKLYVRSKLYSSITTLYLMKVELCPKFWKNCKRAITTFKLNKL